MHRDATGADALLPSFYAKYIGSSLTIYLEWRRHGHHSHICCIIISLFFVFVSFRRLTDAFVNMERLRKSFVQLDLCPASQVI